MVTEESVLDKDTVSSTLSQGEFVDFNIAAQLKDGHSLVVWQYQSYRTRQGIYCCPEGLLLLEYITSHSKYCHLLLKLLKPRMWRWRELMSSSSSSTY